MYNMDLILSDSWDPRLLGVSDIQLRIFNKSVWQENYWAIYLFSLYLSLFIPGRLFLYSLVSGVFVLQGRKLKSIEKPLFLASVLKAKLFEEFMLPPPGGWGKEIAAPGGGKRDQPEHLLAVVIGTVSLSTFTKNPIFSRFFL